MGLGPLRVGLGPLVGGVLWKIGFGGRLTTSGEYLSRFDDNEPRLSTMYKDSCEEWVSLNNVTMNNKIEN